jgi:uncharacterized protein (DUF433 family)
MNKIVIDPKVRHGKPVIKGTRVSVDVILGALAGGMTYEEVCKEYGIKKEDILAAIDYAASIVMHEEIRPIKTMIKK